MPQSDTAASAWPDAVRDAVGVVVEQAYIDGCNEGGIDIADAVLAAIAPHVAAEVAAAERRGRDAAVARCEAQAKENADAAKDDAERGNYHRANHWNAVRDGCQECADAIAALPSSDPGASALAEAVRRAVEAEREANAAIAETMPQPHTENQACPGGPKWRTPDPGGWPAAIAAAIRQRGAGGGNADPDR